MVPGGMAEVYRDGNTLVYGYPSTIGPSSNYRDGNTLVYGYYSSGYTYSGGYSSMPDIEEERRRYQAYVIKFVTGKFGVWVGWAKKVGASRQPGRAPRNPSGRVQRKEALQTTRAHRQAIRALLR